MKPFFIEYRFTAVVMAENEHRAAIKARGYAYDALRDAEPEIKSVRELRGLDELTDGWNGECAPYGGESDLKDLLPETKATKI